MSWAEVLLISQRIEATNIELQHVGYKHKRVNKYAKIKGFMMGIKVLIAASLMTFGLSFTASAEEPPAAESAPATTAAPAEGDMHHDDKNHESMEECKEMHKDGKKCDHHKKKMKKGKKEKSK